MAIGKNAGSGDAQRNRGRGDIGPTRGNTQFIPLHRGWGTARAIQHVLAEVEAIDRKAVHSGGCDQGPRSRLNATKGVCSRIDPKCGDVWILREIIFAYEKDS